MIRTFMDELMAEHIPMPGCPQLIVTRQRAYDFLLAEGYPAFGGFGSVDYMVFHRRPVEEPLTPEDIRDRCLAAVKQSFERSVTPCRN